MKELTSTELGGILERVLERMAFAFPDDPESDDYAWGRHVRIRYTSLEEEGDVVLSASDGFLAEFAAGMLGVDAEDVEPEDLAASLRELANVICGEIVHVLGGAERRIFLGLPEDTDAPGENGGEASIVSHVVEVEGEPLRTVVRHRVIL